MSRAPADQLYSATTEMMAAATALRSGWLASTSVSHVAIR